ncbi:MAG: hypothetical protein Q7J31_11995, partial [Syntrophales bacterium]|nr:hypothetical protein [Syntrophales bacterium]
PIRSPADALGHHMCATIEEYRLDFKLLFLPKCKRYHEDHQLHRRPGSDQDHPQALGSLWLVKSRPISQGLVAPPPVEYVMDGFSQLPMNDDHLYRDPEYPWDAYVQS